MTVQLAAEIWNLLRDSVPYDDREQVADSLVGIMVDHGYDAAEIREEFAGDSEVLKALQYYAYEDDGGEGYSEEDDEYGNDDW